MRKAQMLLLIPLFAMPACSLGVGTRPIVTPHVAECSSLVPDSYRQGVPAPELPAANNAGDLSVFADALIGALEIANGRTRDAVEIVSRCEARDREALQRATRRRFLGIPI